MDTNTNDPATPLKRFAALTPVKNDEMIAIACGWTPVKTQDTIDLAAAVYHERSGQHAAGTCDVCDMARMNQLALDLTLRYWPEALP